MYPSKETMDYYIGWTYSGVKWDLDGNGGPECLAYIKTYQKIIETIAFTVLSLAWITGSYPHLQLPDKLPPPYKVDSTMKRVILMSMCLIFGMEIGFKCATNQLIFILNPCHLITMTQIFLLVAPSNKFTMLVFRVHMHCLTGATIAFLFPVLNTRLLPFETSTYYIQHLMMLVVPYYLMRCGGIFYTEPLLDFNYVFTALGCLFLYHWTFLQWLSIATHVNLNNMLCPAVSDPFYGRFYRDWAVCHQGALILVHGKIYTFLANRTLHLPRRGEHHLEQISEKDSSEGDSSPEFCKQETRSNGSEQASQPINGHLKAN